VVYCHSRCWNTRLCSGPASQVTLTRQVTLNSHTSFGTKCCACACRGTDTLLSSTGAHQQPTPAGPQLLLPFKARRQRKCKLLLSLLLHKHRLPPCSPDTVSASYRCSSARSLPSLRYVGSPVTAPFRPQVLKPTPIASACRPYPSGWCCSVECPRFVHDSGPCSLFFCHVAETPVTSAFLNTLALPAGPPNHHR
jgi:hypothetical protein